MKWFGIILALIGAILFVLGTFTWQSWGWSVLGFLFGIIGIIIICKG